MKYIIGNWKMNMSASKTKNYIKIFKKHKKLNGITFGIAAPYIYLDELKPLQNKILLGAQNVSWRASGALTGEVAAYMLNDKDLDFCIVGHSERRQYFGESNAEINEKIKLLIENKITPILCVGETAKEFDAGFTKDVLRKQLKEALKDVDKTAEIIIAYEPVFAIGTGKIASPELIEKTCIFIKKELVKLRERAENIVLYGGSVNQENASEVFQSKAVDGALVGGASIDPNSFYDIAKNIC